MMSNAISACSIKTAKGCGNGVALVYMVFVTIAVLVYNMIAEGEFSSVLTLSAIFQCLGFSLLALQVLAYDASGISAKSLQLDALALVCRLSSTTWLDGYLPNDKTGDYLYQTFDALSLAMVVLLLHKVMSVQRRQGIPQDEVPAAPFVAGSLLLATVLHGDLDDSPLFDMLWMCGLFISTIAVLPQLWSMAHNRGNIPALTSHFVAVMAVSRILSGTYMWHAHSEISCEPWIGTFNHAGYAILAAHALHLMLLADFAYFYVKNLAVSGLNSPLKLYEAFEV